jgi:hypothetical protein
LTPSRPSRRPELRLTRLLRLPDRYFAANRFNNYTFRKLFFRNQFSCRSRPSVFWQRSFRNTFFVSALRLNVSYDYDYGYGF